MLSPTIDFLKELMIDWAILVGTWFFLTFCGMVYQNGRPCGTEVNNVAAATAQK